MKPWYALVGSERSKRLLSAQAQGAARKSGVSPLLASNQRAACRVAPGAMVSWSVVIASGWVMYSRLR